MGAGDRKGRNYIGITTDLPRRIAEHNAGRTRGDRGRGSFTLIYEEEHPNHLSARAREKYLKSGAGREWLRRKLAVGTESSHQ